MSRVPQYKSDRIRYKNEDGLFVWPKFCPECEVFFDKKIDLPDCSCGYREFLIKGLEELKERKMTDQELLAMAILAGVIVGVVTALWRW
jgi:hypothetical protein